MAGRGRGRGAPGQLQGATWEHDATIKLESKPSDLFPNHPNLKRPAPLADRELRQIHHYKKLQTHIHRGPLFTQPTKRAPDAPAKTFSEDQINAQYGSNRQIDMDPFNGVETYSMRYAPKRNSLPKLSDRPSNMELFPKELWPTLQGTDGQVVRRVNHGSIVKKTSKTSKTITQDPGDKTEAMLERIQLLEDAEEGEDVDEEAADEDMDDEFADDDMGDDYNAEQYFDDGDGDGDDEGGDNEAF